MKALSIQQPWAWAILNAGKDVENRSWSTKYRGTIYIHAGNKFDMEGYQWLREEFPNIKFPLPGSYQTGGIVGKVKVVDCVHLYDSIWFFGPYGFVLREAEPVEFRPMKGKLGLFEI